MEADITGVKQTLSLVDNKLSVVLGNDEMLKTLDTRICSLELYVSQALDKMQHFTSIQSCDDSHKKLQYEDAPVFSGRGRGQRGVRGGERVRRRAMGRGGSGLFWKQFPDNRENHSSQSEDIGVLPKNKNPGILNQSNSQGNHHISKKKITISGAHRIWGTLKSTSVKAIKNVISSLSSISSDNLFIKRKYKNVNSSSAQIWWFVVRADESLLQELDRQWDTITLQTSWQLTLLLQYIPASEIMAWQSDTACNNVADNEVTDHSETVCDTIVGNEDMDVHSKLSAFVDCSSQSPSVAAVQNSVAMLHPTSGHVASLCPHTSLPTPQNPTLHCGSSFSETTSSNFLQV